MNHYTYKSINMQATGRRIREMRCRSNYTVEALSDICGITSQAVCKWQRGDAIPTVDNLLILCDLFGVHVEDLIVRDDDRSSLLSFFITKVSVVGSSQLKGSRRQRCYQLTYFR